MIAHRIRACFGAVLALALVGGAAQLRAQATDSAKTKKYTSPKFWETPTDAFDLTLVVNLRQVQGDKGDSAPWRAARVRIAKDGAPVEIKSRVRTRGQSRLKICDRFPPLWVDFAKDDVKGTVFQHLNRFKLVSPCKVPSDYERYVIQEYNLYRVHELFTPISHRTRLLRLTVTDSASGKVAFTKYAFAVEDLDEAAERLGGTKLAAKGLDSGDLEQRQAAIIGVLQYMIGNTDFSFTALHNTEILAIKGGYFPVVYDFDQAGAITTPYSMPDPSLGIRRVTQRVYRGVCVPTDTLMSVLAEMRRRRPEVEALYADTVGKLMEGAADKTLKYFAEFYKDLENPKTVQNEIVSKCRGGR